MKRPARTEARSMRRRPPRPAHPAVRPLSLRCDPVPRALTDTAPTDTSANGTAARTTPKARKRPSRGGPAGRAHDLDNQRVYLTGLSIQHHELEEVRERFAPNADPTDGAHNVHDPEARGELRYRANCFRGRALNHVRTAPRRRYPPELLNTRGYLIGTEADETHARLSWLYREGLINRNPVSGPAPDWRAAAEDISREELRARCQGETSTDLSPQELALERAADELLAASPSGLAGAG